jgi:hypothetical protein
MTGIISGAGELWVNRRCLAVIRLLWSSGLQKCYIQGPVRAGSVEPAALFDVRQFFSPGSDVSYGH